MRHTHTDTHTHTHTHTRENAGIQHNLKAHVNHKRPVDCTKSDVTFVLTEPESISWRVRPAAMLGYVNLHLATVLFLV